MRFAQGKLREGSGAPDAEILRCAQDDSQDPAHVLSRIEQLLTDLGESLDGTRAID
jgi:hypothetical protein